MLHCGKNQAANLFCAKRLLNQPRIRRDFHIDSHDFLASFMQGCEKMSQSRGRLKTPEQGDSMQELVLFGFGESGHSYRAALMLEFCGLK